MDACELYQSTYKVNDVFMQTNDECPICLTDLHTEDVTQMGCCRQKMHARCYIECISQSQTCPMCRNVSEHRVAVRIDTDEEESVAININTDLQAQHQYQYPPRECSNKLIGLTAFGTLVIVLYIISNGAYWIS